MPFVENETVSLNDLHIAAGGTSETTCSLNDTDIKALRHTGSSESESTASFDQFGVTAVHTFTITTGTTSAGAAGFSAQTSPTFGSISPDPANVNDIYGSWKIDECFWFSGLSAEPIYITLKKTAIGDNASNSGWEHLVIDGNSYFRASADAYNNTGVSSDMQWVWHTDPSNASAQLGYNPFGSSGDSITVKIA